MNILKCVTPIKFLTLVGAFFCFLTAAGLPVNSLAAMTLTLENEETNKKPKKIKDRRHPDYVRCRSEPVMGSLARKRRVCMTNREWVVHIREGNKRANRFVDDLQGGLRTDVP